ncbi:MAG: hypothetical protein JXA67_07810, partial [Micromonosporaceae bacterium]|nr:hypothetical protein [Micromonosporaceae bacterium]
LHEILPGDALDVAGGKGVDFIDLVKQLWRSETFTATTSGMSEFQLHKSGGNVLIELHDCTHRSDYLR